LACALNHLASAAGQVVQNAELANGLAHLQVGSIKLIANLTPDDTPEVRQYSWCMHKPSSKIT